MELYGFKSSDCWHESTSVPELFLLKALWVRPKVKQDVETLHIIVIVAHTILVSN